MAITPGYTAEEIQDFVEEYSNLPHGTKTEWLAAQGVTPGVLKRWRQAVFYGDLDRGLIPRHSGTMSKALSDHQRAQREQAQQLAKAQAEAERLRQRVAQLEQANDALGKAIGRLRKTTEPAPDTNPPAPNQSSS